MSIQNKALTVVSKLRLKTTPTFALEKQTRLVRKQTRFILTLPVAGAVATFLNAGLHILHNLVWLLQTKYKQNQLRMQSVYTMYIYILYI